MKKKKLNIFNIIQYIIIIILIILIGYFSVQKFILKNTSVNFLNYNFYTILSGSMEPTINIKDLVVTHPKDKYETNDIIAFKHDDSVTVHRIVNVEYDDNGTELLLQSVRQLSSLSKQLQANAFRLSLEALDKYPYVLACIKTHLHDLLILTVPSPQPAFRLNCPRSPPGLRLRCSHSLRFSSE